MPKVAKVIGYFIITIIAVYLVFVMLRNIYDFVEYRKTFIGSNEYPLKRIISDNDKADYMIIGSSLDCLDECCSRYNLVATDSESIKNNRDVFHIKRNSIKEQEKSQLMHFYVYRNGTITSDFYWYGEEIEYGGILFEKYNWLQESLLFNPRVVENSYYSILKGYHDGETNYAIFIHGDDQYDLCTVHYIGSVVDLKLLVIKEEDDMIEYKKYNKQKYLEFTLTYYTTSGDWDVEYAETPILLDE